MASSSRGSNDATHDAIHKLLAALASMPPPVYVAVGCVAGAALATVAFTWNKPRTASTNAASGSTTALHVDAAEFDRAAMSRPVASNIANLIGNTPMLRIASLSAATGCNILAKAEWMNPGGSSKDRVALQIIRDAEASGALTKGGMLVEGTSGSTGISLAMLARAFGYRCHVVMPDDQAAEKAILLRQFGATVQLVKPVSIVHDGHYVNVARRVVQSWNAARERPDSISAGTEVAVLDAVRHSADRSALLRPGPATASTPMASSDVLHSTILATAPRSSDHAVVVHPQTACQDCGAASAPPNASLPRRRSSSRPEPVVVAQEGFSFDSQPASELEVTPVRLRPATSSSDLEAPAAGNATGHRRKSSPAAVGHGSAVFCDQFETEANFRAHLHHTGPEIWAQTEGKVSDIPAPSRIMSQLLGVTQHQRATRAVQLDAFVMGAGTGGTLAGVSAYLKPKNAAVTCALVDPPGSSLFNKVMYGVAYATQQAERTLKRHRYDTIIEGVGIDRITANFERGLPFVDTAYQCTDREAVEMSRYLLRNDGIFAGSSTAMNCVGAVKLARQLGPGHTIVTVLCDSGLRHLSRFWNAEYLEAQGLTPVETGTALSFVA